VNHDDRALALAARIADGSGIDWPAAEAAPADADERALLEELKAIAEVATLHRTPEDWPMEAASLAGTRWGPLTLLTKIGEGRFGCVYAAWDARLQRRVALKLLYSASPAALASPTTAIEEARLLARVRHPNVLAVYGAEAVEGQVGIWTEFIEGRTLESLLTERGPLPPEDVVTIGLDLCRALAAVHEAGLLHRDVKAQNVMRETGGRIVLMDFGTGYDLDAVATQAGDLSGTPLYLAPELYIGGRATPQSDVYALGVLLFHLLTAGYPVPGRTLDDVRSGHRLGRTRTLRDLRPNLPDALINAIDRGLSSDPSRRYASAAALAATLVACQAVEPTQDTPTNTSARLGMFVTAFLALVVIGMTILVVGRLRHHDASTSTSTSDSPLALDVRPLNFVGDVSSTAVSQDSKMVAFLRRSESLWIRQTDSGAERQVVSVDASRRLMALTLTPDDASVDVVEKVAGVPEELWRVPLSGGSPQKISANAYSAPGWSPDGKHMAFVATHREAAGTASSIVIADPDGSNQRELTTLHIPKHFVYPGFPISPASGRPAWSPDGRTIAMAGLTIAQPPAFATVILVDAATGAQREIASIEQLSGSSPAIIEVAWIDQTHLAVNRQAVPNGPYQIWTLDVETRAFAQVTHELASYMGISTSSNRQAIVSATIDDRAGIWVGGPAGQGMSVIVPDSSAHPGAGSLDAHGDLVYAANTPNGRAVWVLRSGATAPSVIAQGDDPQVTTQGDAVVFLDVSSRAGVYRVALDGSHLVQLVRGPVSDLTVTPDGTTAMFISHFSGHQGLWAVSLRGGPPSEIPRGAYNPSVSRDGRRLLVGDSDLASGFHAVIVVCDMPACTRARELPMPAAVTHRTLTWALDGRGVAFAGANGQASENIWIQPLDGGPLRQLTHFDDGRTITDFAWSPDGSRLVVSRVSHASDLVWLSRAK
jgi:serine/threonine protein kinase